MKHLFVIGSFLLASSAIAQSSKIEPIVLHEVRIERVNGSCVGEITYRFDVKAANLKQDLGPRFVSLPAIFPCARLDDLLTFKPLPPDRGGAYTFALRGVRFYLTPDDASGADATADARFLRTLTDTDLPALWPPEVVPHQYKSVAKFRLRNAIVGATLQSDAAALAAWPAALSGISVVAGGPAPTAN